MKVFVQNRWQAFGLHLLVSLVVFLFLLSIILFYWYPGFLFLYDGGLQGAKLIAGVDFVIGPVLTLLVYKLGKKSLRFDLTCIVLLQVICLTGGMWAIWQTRPIAIVYATGSFHVTNKQGYKNEMVDFLNTSLLNQSHWPVWVGVPVSNRETYSRVEWATMAYRLAYTPEKYIPYQDMVGVLKEDGLSYASVSELLGPSYHEEDFAEHIRFYMVITSLSEGWLAVDTRNGEVVKAFFPD